MGHILRFARESGSDNLTIDLVHGVGGPDVLLKEPISKLPKWYADMFLTMVKTAGSDRKFVRSATLTATYDLLGSRPDLIEGEPESAYTCDVSISDRSGKEYNARFKGW